MTLPITTDKAQAMLDEYERVFGGKGDFMSVLTATYAIEQAAPDLARAYIAASARVAELEESGVLGDAARDILAERARQISAEGWMPKHDDAHDKGEIASAAAAYAAASTFYHADPYAAVLSIWPWKRAWLKPTNPRRDLVKAGALILAEIERLDRAAALKGSTT